MAAYYAALKALEAQEVDHEQAIRSAFQTLLSEAARPHKWTLIPELGSKFRGRRIIPDGTLRDKYHLPRGYWEAKDAADNLDAEIKNKVDSGYPTTNTIFWTPKRAILYQNKQRHPEFLIEDPQSLCDLLNAFFSYTDPPILDFDEAIADFTERVPALGKRLAEIVAAAHKSNTKFQTIFADFFELCKTALNPNISQAAVDEMLIQHILTERLFKTVFSNPEFLQKNIIAAEVEKVIDALAKKGFFTREEFLRQLDQFYLAIERAAATINDFSDKQHFLNTVYERFFQGYCVRTADTHGIVYTPQPIVDFMCSSVEYVLREEFGKALGDDGVVVLDPCTGTGNFVVNLMRRAAERGPKHLHRMYREQLYANEIMLLPYYIAALNIEHEFFERTGEYEPFEGLCFVDTLELAEAKHTGLFSEANLKRVERQKAAPIRIIVANPPYNAKQLNAGDRNRNRKYPAVDKRIRATFAKDSAATSKIALKDMYVRFWRWAMDRLPDNGIVCFVTNNSFVKQHTMDGMRRHLHRHFSAIYHLDLHGNVRHDPHKSGNAYNVFGIKLGVGITIAVRGGKRQQIRYAEVSEDLRRSEKLLELVRLRSVEHVPWQSISPSSKQEWIKLEATEAYDQMVSIGSKAAKRGQADSLFRVYSRGVATARDSTVYSFSAAALLPRVRRLIEAYRSELDRVRRHSPVEDLSEFVSYDGIKWSEGLLARLAKGEELVFEKTAVRTATYRPFKTVHLYFNRQLNEAVYSLSRFFPTAEADNRLMCVTGVGSERPFATLCTRLIPDLNYFGPGTVPQWFALYTYDDDIADRRENITDWALNVFRGHYQDNTITKWAIFHYVYAVLHHTGYRGRFAENLKRELPRIPFALDFRAFAKAGERLAELHLNYDNEKVVRPYKLEEVWDHPKRRDYRVQRMKLSKDKTTLIYNDHLALRGIPADCFNYRLGNRSALEWVIDQYQLSTDPRSNITSDPNAWCSEHDDAEYILRLVKQVIQVSLETMEVVRSLPEEYTDSVAAPMEASATSTALGSSTDQNQKPSEYPLRSDRTHRQGRLL